MLNVSSYSREALLVPPDSRIHRAKVLAEEFHSLEQDIMAAQRKAFTLADSSSVNLVRLFVQSSLVQFYALKTLVHRIIPPHSDEFGHICSVSEQSVHSARQSIQHHLTCVNLVGSEQFLQKIYVHW